MPAYNKACLKEEEREKYGRRLSHYLEDHTHRAKLTHRQVAKKLGISPNKFSQLKSGTEQGRFITSLDYLKKLATLEGMSLPDFVTYIDGQDKDGPKERPNYTWQDKIYKALESISIPYRRKFADSLASAAQDAGDRVELMCRLASAMLEKDIKALRSLVDAMERL